VIDYRGLIAKGVLGMCGTDEQDAWGRTKGDIVRDITHVLNSTSLHRGTKMAVLNDACWRWTTICGKYDGCRLWSRKAIDARKRDPRVKLIHEHAVPKKIVIEMLLGLESPEENQVRRICEGLLHGVVITREEDRLLSVKYKTKMPVQFHESGSAGFREPMLRYAECGIEVVQCANRLT
jgi:hypothetical protein